MTLVAINFFLYLICFYIRYGLGKPAILIIFYITQMLEQLKQLIEENAQEAIVKNNEVPDHQNEAAIAAASNSIFDTLKAQLTSGNLDNLANIFKGGNVQNSEVAQEASSKFIERLEGLGVNVDAAKNIAGKLIPNIIDKFVNKTNDPNDNSFNLNEIITSISGSDGKFQLSDLTNLLGGGNAGGIVDKLKGLFN